MAPRAFRPVVLSRSLALSLSLSLAPSLHISKASETTQAKHPQSEIKAFSPPGREGENLRGHKIRAENGVKQG